VLLFCAITIFKVDLSLLSCTHGSPNNRGKSQYISDLYVMNVLKGASKPFHVCLNFASSSMEHQLWLLFKLHEGY